MSKPLKILYLVGTDPRNTSYGGEQRTHFIWEGLKKVVDVHTVIPVAHTWQERVDEEDQIRWVKFERRWTPGWIVRRMWSRFFPRIGLPCGGVKPKIKRIFPFSFDVCVVRYVTMASYLKAWQIAPMLLDVDDVLTEEFDSRQQQKKLWTRSYKKGLECYQDLIFERARHLWVSNYSHQEVLTQYPVSWLPNIPITMQTAAEIVSPQSNVLFVGALNCDQNCLGVDAFLKTYWNELHKNFPSLHFKIAGKGLPEAFKKRWLAYPNVTQLGFVKDLSALYQESMCVIAPLYFGSGTSIKVLEALNMGRVCIATPCAVRGLCLTDCVPSNGLVVFYNVDELIAALRHIESASVRLEMQRGARAFIQKEFNSLTLQNAINAVVTKVQHEIK